MFSTTLAAAAVTGLLTLGSVGTQPNWLADYRHALAQSADLHKPVAVFIGHGGAGYAKLVADGGIGADAAKLLRQEYVCVYVDTTTATGKELAGSFRLAEGLVISDRTGAVQALRHEGTVSQADLKQYLVRFAAPAAVTTTESRVAADVAPAAVAPVAQPQYVPQPVMNYGVQPYIPGFGGFGGGCPNCRR